jgi:protease I
MARIAFLIDDMFEDSEFRVPYDRVREAGHEAVVVGLQAGKRVQGKKGKESFVVERSVGEVSAKEFDALVIPGGYSPDHLRTSIAAVGFTRDFDKSEKPIAAICHAGSMLVEADIADGRTVTSWPSVKTDLINAGARWVDREVVEDRNLITSRNPGDLPAFCAALLRQVEHGAADRAQPPLAPDAASERRPTS